MWFNKEPEMRLIRTDAEFALGRQLAVCLCALFLLVGVENGQAAAVAKTVAAPVNSAVVSAAPAPGLPALGVRLLGVMESQMTRKAMIALDGVEKPVLVAQGDLVSGYTVENIEEESVSLKQGADTRHLFVFANVKFVKSNQLAKTVKDVPSETELPRPKRLSASNPGWPRANWPHPIRAMRNRCGFHPARSLVLSLPRSSLCTRCAMPGMFLRLSVIGNAPGGGAVMAVGTIRELTWRYPKGRAFILRRPVLSRKPVLRGAREIM
jgi:hypothetical protein